jgi:hypothetical protein
MASGGIPPPSHPDRFTPEKEPLIPTEKEVGCALQPVWTLRRRYEFLTSSGVVLRHVGLCTDFFHAYLLYRLSKVGRQHRGGCITPQAVTHSLVLLKMGKIISRNMLS